MIDKTTEERWEQEDNKINQKELLEWLKLVFGKGFDTHILSENLTDNDKRSEQVYQQIYELIKRRKGD